MMRTQTALELQAAATPAVRAKTLLGRTLARARLLGVGALSPVDARELMRQVVERVRSDADAKNVDVVVHCSCGPVWVEPEAFSDALYELLDNAVRATRRGHPVMVDVRETADGDVLWQVQDAGAGMADVDLARLGQTTDQAWPSGPGLGVALAWTVVEEHHGLLRFETSPSVGTTASIWLPGARKREPTEPPVARKP
jgi:two-component system sporulation sensor kinase A